MSQHTNVLHLYLIKLFGIFLSRSMMLVANVKFVSVVAEVECTVSYTGNESRYFLLIKRSISGKKLDRC